MTSPCNQTCKIDLQTGFCIGCGRSLDEIEVWPVAAEAWKRQIMIALPARIAAFGQKPRPE